MSTTLARVIIRSRHAKTQNEVNKLLIPRFDESKVTKKQFKMTVTHAILSYKLIFEALFNMCIN